VLRVATRGSALARWQANEIVRLLVQAHPSLEVEIILVETTGDQRRDVPVSQLGGQGVFVKEVELAVLEGRADIAVHSAKDLPSVTDPGLLLACIPARGDPRDALVGATLAELGPGAPVATGSVRRRAQLAGLRPDLTFLELRGNIGTRLTKVPPGGAVVVAMAALVRLDLAGQAAEILDPAVMLPQVGQGALAIECRAGDHEVLSLLAALEDPQARAAVTCERGFLARVGGGCDLPVGAYAQAGPGGGLTVDALLASADGRVILREQMSAAGADRSAAAGTGVGVGQGPAALGAALADRLLAAGGAQLLKDGSAGTGAWDPLGPNGADGGGSSPAPGPGGSAPGPGDIADPGGSGGGAG
jgi:hydroxymethylbilane synthase